MAEFLRSQIDYILFFYGMAFLLLIPICLFLRRRSYRKLPWIWLVWFGALHGANEGLGLVALSLEPGPAFHYVRLGVLVMSFGCLAEFGRAGTRIICGRGPGRWILAAMVALAGVGGLAGFAGLSAASRYVLGLIGGLWAAGTLFLAAKTEPSEARPLQIGALCMAGYALATGLVVDPAPFFPASWLNCDSFLAFTGVPIQLIRALIVLSIGACLYRCAQTCWEKDHHFHIRFRHRMMWAMAALLLITGWAFTQHLGDIASRDKLDDYEHDAEMLRQSLTDKMAEADRLVKTISSLPAIYSPLATMAPQTIQQANTVLDICSQTLPESVCYLMDLSGLTIASSNRDHPDSFVGKSFAVRPYFKQALQGSAGRYWAMGATSKELGYYASFPVRDRSGQIIGAAVTKRAFVDLKAVMHLNHIGLIIDQRGIVFMSNRPDMVLRSLWPLSNATKRELLASRQFGDGPFTPIMSQKPPDKFECIFEGKRQLALIKPIPCDGSFGCTECSLVIFSSIWPIAQARLLGIIVTLLFYLLLVGFFTIVVIMQESEEGFSQLVENAADSLILHDRGRIIEVNQQTCRSLGYTREELLRMSVFDIEVGYDKKFLIDLWEKGGEVVNLSGIYRRKDGLTFPTEIRAGEITYRGQTLRLASARDVSARKQAEEALKESEQYYRSLFNNMLNGYAYCQLFLEQGRPVDFIFLNVNKAFKDLTGLTDVIGKKVSEAIPGIRESDPEFVEMCGRVALTGIPERAEIYLDSLKMWFSISVYSPLKEYFVVILDVITERKRSEEALRASEEALRQGKENYRNLAGQLLTAQEAERKRLARELHDDLSQRLAGLAMEAEMLEQQIPRGCAVKLKEMKDKLVAVSIDVHSMSRQLHPSILDDLGLPDAIVSECARFRRQDSIVVDFRSENITKEIPQDVAVCLYRITQEGLRNISRHAGASEVTISLVGKNDAIFLTIMDNGRGFNPDRIGGKQGLGLNSMKERAYLVGGDFSIKSQPERGVVINVVAPLSRSSQ